MRRPSRPEGGRATDLPCRAVALALLVATCLARPVAAGVTLERIAASGDTGVTGFPQSQVFAPAEDPMRHVVFLSRIAMVFRRAESGVGRELGAGSLLPGGGTVAGVGIPAIDDEDCTVVGVVLVGGDEGVYRVCPGDVTRIVGRGDTTISGERIDRIDFTALEAAGPFVAFAAWLDDDGDAILRSDGSDIVVVARPGDPSPVGGVLTTVRVVGLAAGGTVGIRAAVSGGRDGLFGGSGGMLAKALVAGDATLVGRLEAIEQASMSQHGIWAFRGTLQDGRAGMFRFDGTQSLPLVEAVALTGQAVAERPGTTIRDFATSVVPSVNGAGDVAFRAVLGGDATGAGLFATQGAGPPALLLTTRDATAFGLLARLGDPRLADDGSVAFSATPVRGGTGVFVHRDGTVGELARFGTPTDLGRPDLRFRFVDGRVRGTAEGGRIVGEHDGLVRAGGESGLESLVAFGSPSPIGGQFVELGPPEVDSRGRVFFRGGVADSSRGEGIFAAVERGIVSRVATNDRVPGGRLRDVVERPVELGGDLSSAQRVVAFAGLVGAGGGTGGLYALRGGGRRRLERTGRKRRGIGELLAFGGRPAFVARRRYAFVAQVRDGQIRESLVVRRGRRWRVAAQEGASPYPQLTGRLVGFSIPDAIPEAVVFRVTTAVPGVQGIIVDDWRAPRLAVASGDLDTAGRIIRAFERPVLAGRDVVVATMLDAGGRVVEGVTRFPAVPDDGETTGDVETLVLGGDEMPGGGALHDVLSLRGTARGAVLIRAALRTGPARQVLLRMTSVPNLDPPGPSQ